MPKVRLPVAKTDPRCNCVTGQYEMVDPANSAVLDRDDRSCSCHISPPCSYCVDMSNEEAPDAVENAIRIVEDKIRGIKHRHAMELARAEHGLANLKAVRDGRPLPEFQGTAEDGSGSAREASAVPQDQGATPDPQEAQP